MKPEEIKAEQQRLLGGGTPVAGKARGRVGHTQERMNKLERAYADHLNLRIACGEVACWDFEAVKFKLANRCWYTVDFLVQLPDGTLELHECKGFLEDDAAVKLRLMPRIWGAFRLFIVRRKGGAWEIEERS
jgi:hypothetical protein